MENVNKRVYALYRVSTIGQVDIKENDIPMQRDFCRAFVNTQPGWILERELQEKGVSGFKVSAKDRDAIQELQEAALRGLFDVLLVFMFDRLGRRDDETPFVVEWFVKQGIEVWSATEGQQRFDNHVDKLLNYIRYWQASGESIKTSVRTKTRLEQLTEEGCYTGGFVPYGYRLVNTGRTNKRGKEVYDLAIVPEEAEIIRAMFYKYVNEGYGCLRLCRYLNGCGIKSKRGNLLSPPTISRMLRNEIYMGVLHNGDAKAKLNPALAIIDEDMFQKAQDILAGRRCGNTPSNMKGSALLSGNIYCGHCRKRLALVTSGGYHKRKDGTNSRYTRFQYSCEYNKNNPLACDGQRRYSIQKVDAIVEAVLRIQFAKIKAADRGRAIAMQRAREIEFENERYRQAQRLYEEKAKELEDLKAEALKVIRGTSELNMSFLNELVEETMSTLKTAEQNVQKIKIGLEELQQSAKRAAQEYDQLLSWADVYDECSFEARKVIVSQFVKAVYVHRGYDMEIEFNVSFEDFQRFDCNEEVLETCTKEPLHPSA